MNGIQALPIIAKYKPELKQDIENALSRANPSGYKENPEGHSIVLTSPHL